MRKSRSKAVYYKKKFFFVTEARRRGNVDGRTGTGRLLHDERQRGRQAPPLQLEFDELHGDGELQPVHLAVDVQVGQVPGERELGDGFAETSRKKTKKQ